MLCCFRKRASFVSSLLPAEEALSGMRYVYVFGMRAPSFHTPLLRRVCVLCSVHDDAQERLRHCRNFLASKLRRKASKLTVTASQIDTETEHEGGLRVVQSSMSFCFHALAARPLSGQQFHTETVMIIVCCVCYALLCYCCYCFISYMRL